MIAIITDPAVGGTFLNWSIHYLAGETEYYSAWTQKLVPLNQSPLSGKNAHGFNANQIHNIKEFNKVIDSFDQCPAGSLRTMYFHHFHGSTDSADPSTCRAVSLLNKPFIKKIFLTLSPEHALYHCSYEKRHITLTQDFTRFLVNSREILEDFINHHFPNSKAKWDQLQLNETWDLREFVALNIDPFSIHSVRPMIELVESACVVNAVELMTMFDVAIYDIFKYLEISIDPARFEHWLSVYAHWKKVHQQRIKFMFNFQLIVDSIVSGCNVDLTRFDLDIMQEAAIQRALIYNHGLNLKTWQLEKFTNTAQLHALLEPNFHPL